MHFGRGGGTCRLGLLAAVAALCAPLAAACSGPEAPSRRVETPAPAVPVESAEPLAPLSDLPQAEAPAEVRKARLAFPYLEGEAEGASVSIGDTTHGRVVNAKELEESSAIKILPRQKERDLKYGTDNMIGLLEHAGRALFDKTHTPMWIGNIGKREGGDIEWSVSHNAGRDADVAFCYKDPVTGKPVDPPDLVQLGKDGLSKDKKLAFDAPRTWAVVRAMIEFEGASLQYLFISEPLKKKLIEHAKAAKEPAYLLDRAAELLRQPGAAAAHDDHLHVRIYCSAMDAAGGCRDMGLTQTFAKRFDGERPKAAERARKQLADAKPEKRRKALLRLGLVGEATVDLPTGVTALSDPSPLVRSGAVELVAALGSDRDTPALTARFRVEDDPAVMAALVEGIGFLGGKDAGPFFRDVLLATASAPVMSFSDRALPLDTGTVPFFLGLADDPYPPMRSLLAPTPVVDLTFDRAGLQRLAVRAVRHAGTLEPVEPLVELLDTANPKVAVEAADALAFLTNQRFLDDKEDKPLSDRIREAKARYGKLVSTMGKSVRDGWLINGFASRGYKVRSLDRRSAWEILRAVNDEPHLSYNARAALVKMFGQPKEVVDYGVGDACRLLFGILWERRGEGGIERPTDVQRAACVRATHDMSATGTGVAKSATRTAGRASVRVSASQDPPDSDASAPPSLR